MSDLLFTEGKHTVVDGDIYRETKRRQAADAVWARGTSEVSAYGLHQVSVWDQATLRSENCRNVRATHDGKVDARGWSVVYALDRSRVVAKDDTIVFAYGSSEVIAQDRAVVVLEGFPGSPNNSQVRVIGRRVLVIDRRGRTNKMVMSLQSAG